MLLSVSQQTCCPARLQLVLLYRTASTGDVLDTKVTSDAAGVTYYHWDVKPHRLVSATAVGSRVFILSAQSNPRQWKKFEAEMRVVRDSFIVPERKA